MKHGAFNIIPKANDKGFNGTIDIPAAQESSHVKSQIKTILVTFFDIKGTVHFE
jgi:hypothetical protein